MYYIDILEKAMGGGFRIRPDPNLQKFQETSKNWDFLKVLNSFCQVSFQGKYWFFFLLFKYKILQIPMLIFYIFSLFL